MAKATIRDSEPAPVSKQKISSTQTTSRGRKPAASNGKEPATTQQHSHPATSQQQHNNSTQPTNSLTNQTAQSQQSPWSQAPLSILHTYRSFHRLPTPSAYANPHAHTILSYGIGLSSPSSAGISKDKRRQQKEDLAKVVRRHFNAGAVNENDAIVNTLYKARTSEKSLRLKFLPGGKQR